MAVKESGGGKEIQKAGTNKAYGLGWTNGNKKTDIETYNKEGAKNLSPYCGHTKGSSGSKKSY